jgi:class 3 adenylate cyclase
MRRTEGPELHYRWEWRLRSSPEELWPLASNTDRFNRDSGLPAVHAAPGAPSRGHRSLGLSMLGVKMEWDEEPFEWVRPYRFGVRRRYRRGPWSFLQMLAQLFEAPGGGTRLVYEAWVRPRGSLARLLVPVALGVVQRRAFARAFHEYDAAIRSPGPASQRTVSYAPGGRERLEALGQRLGADGKAPLADRLVAHVKAADPMELARMRPYALADRWGESRREVLELMLEAARAGLLDLRWDVLCPLCRGVKQSNPALVELDLHVDCEACDISSTADFERSVEVTFRPAASICAVDDATYCVGGPQMTPHIVAQHLLAPGERRSLEVPLEPGRYRLRAVGSPGQVGMEARAGGSPRAGARLGTHGWDPSQLDASLGPVLEFANETASEQVVVLERTAWSDQAATAAEVIGLQRFRDLFSSEVLRPGEHVSGGTLAVVFTDLRESTRLYRAVGDAPAFGRVMDHFAVLREAVNAEGGTLVKTIGDAIMAVFARPAPALRAMLRAQAALAAADAGQRLYLKAGINCGPCLAVTLNERLDYFGSTVNLAARLEASSTGEDIVLSEGVLQDPEVESLLHDLAGLEVEECWDNLKGFDEGKVRMARVRRRPTEAPANEGSSGR